MLESRKIEKVLRDFFKNPDEELLRRAIGSEKAEALLYALAYGVKDPLTGLFLRSLLLGSEERLGSWQMETLRAKRYKHNLTLCLIDLDGLKQINDGFGYEACDRMIEQLVAVFKLTKRATDILVRWGGDEFVIVLPETDKKSAILYLERVKDQLPEGVEISYGVACWKDNTFEEVFGEANSILQNEKTKKRATGRSSEDEPHKEEED